MENDNKEIQTAPIKRVPSKAIYWIIGVILAAIIFSIGLQMMLTNTSSTNSTAGSANSSATSGSGNNTHNPAQEIQKHLKQMGF